VSDREVLTLNMLIEDAVVEGESDSHRVWMRKHREVAATGNGLRRAWPWPPRVVLPSEMAGPCRQCVVCDEVYPLTDEFFPANKNRQKTRIVSHRKECRGCARIRHRNLERHKVRDTPLQYRYRMIRKGALRRGHRWGFKSPEGLRGYLDAPCHYCGGEVETRLALDRIDSMKGYTPGNVVSCCWRCNRCKVDLSTDEWYAHMEKILAHRKGGGEDLSPSNGRVCLTPGVEP